MRSKKSRRVGTAFVAQGARRLSANAPDKKRRGALGNFAFVRVGCYFPGIMCCDLYTAAASGDDK